MGDEREPPKVFLASSRADDKIDPPWTEDDSLREIEGRTRELVANMIQVMRGAGRPSDLFDQIVDLYWSIEHCPAGTTERKISSAIAAALDVRHLDSAIPENRENDWRG